MARPAFSVIAAVLAAWVATACERANPVAPTVTTPTSTDAGDAGLAGALMGSWQSTRAVAWREVHNGSVWVEVPGSRRDLVAEGGLVTMLLVPNGQRPGNASPPGRYTISVAMPGRNAGTDGGVWFFGPAWQSQYQGLFQMDFYPDSLGPDFEYGDIPAFLVSLSDDQQTLKLWDSGLSFLPYDFGWKPWDTVLELDFVRQ